MKPEMNPEMAQRLTQAGAEIYTMVIRTLADERGVHLETALAAAGYLTGAAILKDCGVNLATFAPGTPIFIDKANETGPEVVNYMMGRIAQGQQTGAHDLKAPPSGMVPDDNQPHRSHAELLSLLWAQFERTSAQHRIPVELTAYAAASAAAKLVVEGQMMLVPAVAKTIVVEAMVKAAKTVPPMPLTPAASARA